MKNMKFWRTALVATLVLTVMLSVTGGTIAWFTDSVTSSANVIQSGTLDITVLYGDAKTQPDESWTDIENTSEALFSHDLWEPGYVASKGVQIVNKGSLALKFQLEFLPNEQSTGEYKLEDVIDVYVSESPVTDRTALGNKVGTLASLMNSEDEDGAVHGELYADASDTVYISLKMQESAGNDYQGLSVGGGFGLKIVATQLAYEPDSFGQDYDEDAKYATVVHTAEELVKALQNGGDIELGTNIEVKTVHGTNGTVTGSTYGDAFIVGKDTVINLNGHNIIMDDFTELQGALFYIRNAELTVEGSGEILVDYANWVWAGPGAVMNIAGGSWRTENTVPQDDGDGICASNGGKVNISNGFFQTSFRNMINTDGKSPVTVTGGTFVGKNPANAPDGNTVAEGYNVITETQPNGDVWYTVVAADGE